MTKEQIRAVLDRVLTWPPERQEDAVTILELIEEQDRSGLQLTEDQRAEVRRRRAEKNAETLTLEQFDHRLRRFGV
jgi:hypothetical protein